MNVLLTGNAGFIGFHLASKLIKSQQFKVFGIDSINDYYDVNLKKARLEKLFNLSKDNPEIYTFVKGNIANQKWINEIFDLCKPQIVIHLAAQAGVRYSIENPHAYVESNIIGFTNILEASKNYNVEHFIYASSSSVYGGNKNVPLKEKDNVDHPVSFYGATKKSNELMAHAYSHLFGLPTTGLRFFTVYGPWGRPDMALFLFTKAILTNQPINIFNNGNMIRDFTFIDDVIESIFRLIEKKPILNSNFDSLNPNPSKSWAPYQIFNIGNSNPINLNEYIKLLEKELGREAKKNFMPMQDGDVQNTEADTTMLNDFIHFKPNTPIEYGVKKFISWYKNFYSIS